jgi:glycosyltransferase involved in cell wall biosynthesis
MGEAKWDFFRSADLMVLPSHSENFGIVVAEALAVGLPLSLAHPGRLENYQCGWWIDLSVDSLKRCLEQVMQSSRRN